MGARNNNFDLLRILAALQVAIVHATTHLGVPLGSVAELFPGVPVFFVISGYLVSQSFHRSHTLPQYFLNRALRIFPALWVCLVVSLLLAFAFGGVTYDPALWPWLAGQLTFVQFYNPDFLRSFGVGTLNGSLWTIPVELQFYLALPFLAAALTSNPARMIAIAALMGVNVAFVSMSDSLVYKLIGVTLAPYLFMFLLGLLLERNQEFVRRYLVQRLPLWLCAFLAGNTLLWLAGLQATGNHMNPLSAVLLALLVISAAYAKPIRLRWDLSYGLYLYHMPIINVLNERGLSGFDAVAFAVALSVIAAIVSWLGIEKPALLLKSRSHGTKRLPSSGATGSSTDPPDVPAGSRS